MAAIDNARIETVLKAAHADGRCALFEHECYQLLAATGAEAAPASRLIDIGSRPTSADLEALTGDKVVLKVVSPDIIHKTEARGVRIVTHDLATVQETFDLMLREVPKAYAAYLETNAGEAPAALAGLRGEELEERLEERIVGILLCSFVPSDVRGFATELFVGIRDTREFGPIISAGLGGVEMEILARQTRKGAAVAIAPTGTINGKDFFELFRSTLSYERLSGSMRGSERLVEDGVLEECFQAFIDLANQFSTVNPEAEFHLEEVEVNPFAVSGARLAPLDGVCSFKAAIEAPQPRPIEKIGNLLRPKTAAVIGVSERSMNMGRIILNNLFDAGFDRDQTFVVHPAADSIDGVQCVAGVGELPIKVDLFVVAVSAAQVPNVVTELIEHDRANAVILIPGGLGEKEGSQDLENELKGRIRAAHLSASGGPVFLGGNSLGVISHPGHYDTMFIPESKLPKSRGSMHRKLCFLSQSGAFIISNISRMP
jgi:acyl-CoA synthetase (NDP forming)